MCLISEPVDELYECFKIEPADELYLCLKSELVNVMQRYQYDATSSIRIHVPQNLVMYDIRRVTHLKILLIIFLYLMKLYVLFKIFQFFIGDGGQNCQKQNEDLAVVVCVQCRRGRAPCVS